MIDYTENNTRKKTSQTEAILGRENEMISNNAGGVVFAADKWTILNRFLILGSEGGSYYTIQKDLTKANTSNLRKCIKEDGLRTLQVVIDISVAGRAPRNDQAIFAMAMLMTFGAKEVRITTGENLSKVCRIGTHLFMYAHYINALRGWGSVIRKSVSSWYNDKDIQKLQYQVLKYQGRQIEKSGNKWTHKDVLRLAHVKPKNDDYNDVFKYVVNGTYNEKNDLISAVEELKATDNIKHAIALIDEYNLPHETWPTELKNVPEVWEIALPSMPMNATIRNLGKLSSMGLLGNLSKNTEVVIDKIGNKEAILKSRIHPMQILTAMAVYQNGQGVKGKLSWAVTSKIVDALNEGFYTAFGNVKKTGKNHLLALDVSGSMTYPMSGSELISCRIASAAMALITANVEDNYEFIGFTSSGKNYMNTGSGQSWASQGVSLLSISPKQRLDDVIKYISRMDFGGTDCALPMIYAEKNKLNVDSFFVYTDNETWAGGIQPSQALKSYRKAINPSAKLGVIGMVANDFTIADPKDSGMIDVVGFDSSTPQILSAFTLDEI